MDPSDFELIQMDTDSCYMGIAAKTLDSWVKPELRSEYEREKCKWQAWDKRSS